MRWIPSWLSVNAGHMGSVSGSGRSPGVGNGNLLRVLAWEIPWSEEPGRLQSVGSLRVGHDSTHVVQC